MTHSTAPVLMIGPCPVARAPVPTALSVWAGAGARGNEVVLSVREEQNPPHRPLVRDLIQVGAPRAAIARLTVRVASLCHHLHVAMESGTTTRLRKAGTFRARWHVDLLRAGALACTWPVEADRIDLDELDRRLVALDAPATPAFELVALGSHMRGAHAEIRRDHLVDQTIRNYVDLPIDELIALLERGGLLDPTDA